LKTKLSKEPSGAHYEKFASIINVLGDPDTLRILDKAATEFESGKTIIKELKMTPRKYYRNLSKLNEKGLVESFDNKYRLTSLGKFMHKLLFNDALPYLISDQNQLEPIKNAGNQTELRAVTDYRELISLLATLIEKSKDEVLLATRYLDIVVVQSILFALQRGIKIKTITSEKVEFSAFIKLIGGFVRNIRPNALKFIAGGESNYRSGDVPMSFILIDGEIAVFEIPDKKFRLAFISTNKEVEEILSALFWEIWKESKALHMPNL
jgi:sugar-specific transcriptional regulator TrmB